MQSNNIDSETKKFIDELVDWDGEKKCFKTSVERQLEIISKLDDNQKACLKDYLANSGYFPTCDFDLKIIKMKK